MPKIFPKTVERIDTNNSDSIIYMPGRIFEKSVYHFDIHDADYLEALTSKVGDLKIENITPDYSISYQNAKIKDLPHILAQINAKKYIIAPSQIKVTTKTYDLISSLKDVLPSF